MRAVLRFAVINNAHHFWKGVSMYVVIFRAKPGTIDNNYSATAARLRELAFSDFGCIDFVSAAEENGNEVALSYWPDLDSIRQWKAHSDHVMAQELGREKWYASYLVQIAEIKREYRFPA
jgi:heme-degrading monooxygenase HmoA